ncbi:protein toll-like [Euwallacea fornicatus]|uniref:protein toll-like n=1 Tax=Euwallacea fornicatus TaxID=995702 RepID=UPI00338EF0DC
MRSTKMTVNVIWTTLFIIVCLCQTTLTIDCEDVDTTKCDCFEYDTTDVQCPKTSSRITISISKSHHVTIQCDDESNSYLDIDLLPDINISDAKYFKIDYCYLNTSFHDILEKFNIQNLSVLTFEGLSNSHDNFTVTKESLKSLQSLERLTLSHGNLHLERNFLVNTPNLLVLSILRNSTGEIDRYFDHVPKLRLLDMTSNYITSIPNGVFQELSNLTKLMLFGNNISSISRSKFSGLTNLMLLELSWNQLEEVPEDTFADLRNLINISLRGNHIRRFYSYTFINNNLLQNIRLGNNSGVVMENGIFANLTALVTVELSGNKLEAIPENLFEDCVVLREVDLSGNSFTTLPGGVFRNSKKMIKLNLSQNKLMYLPDDVFASMVNLKELKLYGNRLNIISDNLLRNLDRLESLYLQKNEISEIRLNAFSALKHLKYLDMSTNKWNNSYFLPITPLWSLTDVEIMLLSHNQLTDVPQLLTALYLTTLNISHNLITNISIRDIAHSNGKKQIIDVSHNKIQEIDFRLAGYLLRENLRDSKQQSIVLDIRNNPILCDCSNYDLIVYNNETELKTFIDIKQDGLVCFNDKKTKVLDLAPNDVECPIADGCPESCKCSYKSMVKAVVVDCSFRNFTTYPDFNFHMPHEQTYLLLSGNQLTQGPSGNEGNYHNITLLDLSRNAIAELKWIPPHIKELNLDGNSFKNFNKEMVMKLKNATALESLHIKGNPWMCNCKSQYLQEYLRHNFRKVNPSDVACTNVKSELLKLSDICKVSPYLMIVLPVILACLLLFAIALLLYYHYQTEIKVYLYAKNLCLWFVTEEELDKSKTYDVFISYAHQDEKFVEEHLLPELECKDHPYKVCIHIRDWIPGQFIAEQVVNSVRDSRRTLVVLSNNFVDSIWGKLEFRTAHTEAIAEGRARVVVVLFEDLDEGKLDDELKSYLKTNTYVRWGDKYFWNKLKYALPHSRGNFYEANKKHAKVMLKIDDKFDLIKTPPSPSNTSTPPIILDPAFLESKELAINLEKQIEGEYPLLVKAV